MLCLSIFEIDVNVECIDWFGIKCSIIPDYIIDLCIDLYSLELKAVD